ncbi:MAG: hypothetical protein K9M11_00895 [Candidatus Pacebacteria bacterium]|nr:hypothetical protein [Candidatus Paceibacterota bacterium]
MQTYQKILLAIVVIINVTAGAFLYAKNAHFDTPLTGNDPSVTGQTTSTSATTTSPTGTNPTPTAITPNGTCGLLVTSHNPNGKASLLKPITVSGVVNNTNRQSLGCSWTMFEGQLGSAHAYAFVNNAWKSISTETPVPVANWMTDKTTFKVEIAIDTGTMNIAEGTPLKVVFAEENPAAINPSKTYTLALVTAYGELNQNTNEVPQMMSLTIYQQDKSAVTSNRCDATKVVTYQVPKTVAVADASLKLLFSEELSNYGAYSSVSIENNIAKIQLSGVATPSGRSYASLSSCEIGHITSVLTDTLTQYSSIKSVQLYSPEGRIVF